MTPEQALHELTLITTRPKGDQEAQHMQADAVLCELLEYLGYKEIVDMFDKIDKWYA